MDVPGRRGDGEQTPIVYEETRKEKDSSMTRLHAFEMWKLKLNQRILLQHGLQSPYGLLGCSLPGMGWAAVVVALLAQATRDLPCTTATSDQVCVVPSGWQQAACRCQLIWQRGCPNPSRKELTCNPPLTVSPPPSPPRGCGISAGPVQVFVLTGQSNMIGYGLLEGTNTNGGDYTLAALVASGAAAYQHLRTEDGTWQWRDDVNVELYGFKRMDSPLTAGLGRDANSFGPELQYGQVLGVHLASPVLLLKIAWGGSSLHTDFRPPTAAASRGGVTGARYTELVSIVASRLAALGRRGIDYELAGFAWHQGWNDGGSWAHVDEYESNLADLMGDLRDAFDAPELPFVIAASGMDGWTSASGGRRDALCEAQRAATRRDPFANSTAYVETRDYARPREVSPNPSQGYHWSWNAESLFLIGQAMGEAAVRLMACSSPPHIPVSPPAPRLPPSIPTPPSRPSADVTIAAAFLAQTHVLPPESPHFKLVGGRSALLKVQLAGVGPSPLVTAIVVAKGGEEMRLTLSGPSQLPSAWTGTLGQVQHTLDDSYTATIAAAWVAHGMTLHVLAAGQALQYELAVGAPSAMRMLMYDVHYFGAGVGDYPSGWEAELASKWPVASFEAQRIRGVRFLEMVIPARTDVGAPAVRVRSKADYSAQTGLPFDGEQAAALEWVHALSAAGGNEDTQMCYINILGVPAGGQAGAFDGVGAVSAGILNHELGHAFSLPHWGAVSSFPYRGDMHGITAPSSDVHVGPTWAFDEASMTFLPPTCRVDDALLSGCDTRALEEGEAPPVVAYKKSPMQGGGTGDQPPPFLFRHFSDYAVRQMQEYIEGKLAVPAAGGAWTRWNEEDGTYSNDVSTENPSRYPLETGVQVMSLMAACILAGGNVSIVYPPIGPYTAGLTRRFVATSGVDRADAVSRYCPSDGCDFSLRVLQGTTVTVYMLPASATAADDPYAPSSLRTVAINVPTADGPVLQVELLATPDAQFNGLPAEPEILQAWTSDLSSCGDVHHPAVASANIFEGAVRNGDVADFQAATGEFIEWELAGCVAGRYAVAFEYYAGTCDRPLELSVDGAVLAPALSFPSTGGWSHLGVTASTTVVPGATATVRIRLKSIGYSGNNILRLNLHAEAEANDVAAAAHADRRAGQARGPGWWAGQGVGCPFYSKAAGGQSCAAGALVDTEAMCRDAAAELGMPFRKAVHSPSGRPAGCFWDQNGSCYFNTALETSNIWMGTGGACKSLPDRPP